MHPLEVALGLTRDLYRPLVIGWFCRLATRMSFQVASGLGQMSPRAAPPASAIEEWVLGLARPAYVNLSDGPLPKGDGDVLVEEKRKIMKKVIGSLKARVKLMDYGRLRKEDLVISSGVVEGAARNVVGERLDNSEMRWIEERAEAVLLLGCIEVNGDWEDFMRWSQERRSEDLERGQVVQIRFESKMPTQLPEAA